MEGLQFVSIILELLIALICVITAVRGRTYMYGLAFTFAIYVFYDLARALSWDISETVLVLSFFIATLAALYSVWHIYRHR